MQRLISGLISYISLYSIYLNSQNGRLHFQCQWCPCPSFGSCSSLYWTSPPLAPLLHLSNVSSNVSLSPPRKPGSVSSLNLHSILLTPIFDSHSPHLALFFLALCIQLAHTTPLNKGDLLPASSYPLTWGLNTADPTPFTNTYWIVSQTHSSLSSPSSRLGYWVCTSRFYLCGPCPPVHCYHEPFVAMCLDYHLGPYLLPQF